MDYLCSTMKKEKKPQLEFYLPVEQSDVRVAYIDSAEVHAGFPSPVDAAYLNQPIDLNKELIRNPSTSFIVKVAGDSMIDEGIDAGDMLVVDRSLFPTEKSICVVALDGEFAVKRIVQRDGRVYLMAGNPAYSPIEVPNPEELRLWGVVTWVMKKK